MPQDLFLQLLMKHSTTRLRELRADADEKIRQGQLEKGYIDRALALKEGHSDLKSPSRVGSSRTRKASSKVSNTREYISTIVESDPERVWMPSEVRDELARRFNVEAHTGTIRATMKRLLDDGQFARPGDGAHGFKLASTNGSHPGPHAEATNSVPGGYERQEAPAPKDGLE